MDTRGFHKEGSWKRNSLLRIAKKSIGFSVKNVNITGVAPYSRDDREYDYAFW
jgi:hypothetical protein